MFEDPKLVVRVKALAHGLQGFVLCLHGPVLTGQTLNFVLEALVVCLNVLELRFEAVMLN